MENISEQGTSGVDSSANDGAVGGDIESQPEQGAVGGVPAEALSEAADLGAVGGQADRILSLSESDKDILRMIAENLESLGLKKTVETLGFESGLRLEHPQAARLRDLVMEGQWDLAETHVDEMELNKPQDITAVKHFLLEQKFLELVEDGFFIDALICLRQKLTPLNYDTPRIHMLSTFLMCGTAEELRNKTDWPGKGPVSRENLLKHLQKYISTSVMVPSDRLKMLLTHAVQFQTDNCLYHNTSGQVQSLDNVSLLKDHSCSAEHFPCVSTQTLREDDPTDEVWFCRFSPDGTRIATGSKTGCLTVYNVDMVTGRLRRHMIYAGVNCNVSHICWSPDSRSVIVCGPDSNYELYVRDVVRCTTVLRLNEEGADDHVSYAVWFPDGRSFVTGGVNGQAIHYKLDGTKLAVWHGIRVQYLDCLPRGRTVIAADTSCRIRGYNFDTHTEFLCIREDHNILSFRLNREANLILLNLGPQGLHMWDLNNRTLMRRFRGNYSVGEFVLHSTFGGENETFIASGSEDGRVYIWRVDRELPIACLEGHFRTSNCVDWNPVIPGMLASASDDGSLRIWMPSPLPTEEEPATPSTLSTSPGPSEEAEPDSGDNGGVAVPPVV